MNSYRSPGVATRREIFISAPKVETFGNTTRVTSEVNGTPLWFESDDADLEPSPEAFGSALLFPGQHRGRTLRFESPVSEAWLENSDKIMQAWHEWWGYRPRRVIATRRPDENRDARSTALMFSGGVDSFHCLLAGAEPHMLVAVHGFDIPLDDSVRMAWLRRSLDEVADAHGCKPIVVRTNLREHPASGKRHLWDRAHGGGLISIGHLLSRQIGRLVVAASWFYADERPFGSHTRTDPLYAANGFSADHFGNSATREDKIACLAFNDLARRHLRVCWKNLRDTANCSRCEKCVIAMLHLAENGVLSEFGGFDSHDLPERIDGVPYFNYYLLLAGRILERRGLDEPTLRSLEKAIARSRRIAPALKLRSRFREIVDRVT